MLTMETYGKQILYLKKLLHYFPGIQWTKCEYCFVYCC